MWLRRNEGKKTSPFWYGLNYLKKYKLKLFAAVFVSVCYALIPMQIPVITGFLVDGLTMSGNINQSVLYDTFRYFHYGPNFFTTPEDILYFCLVSLLIVAILYGVTAYFRVYLRSSISRNFMFELQRAMVQKLEFLSLAIHKKYGSGNILNHIIIDSNNVRPFVETTIVKTTTNIVRISYPLVILFIIDPILALIAYSVLPPLFFTIKLMQSSLSNILKRQRNDRSRLVTLLKENLDNIETIQSSAAEQRSIENISKRIQTIETAQIKSQHIYALMIGAAWSLTALGIAVTWWYGGHQVLRNDITLGQLVTFTGFLLFAYEPVRYFTKSIRDYRRSIIALKHIQDLLELPSSVDENSDLKPLNITNGSIQLQNIFFSLDDVNNPKLETKDLSILTPIHYTKDKYKKIYFKRYKSKNRP